ncbi:MAG: response regulator transcription factor [Actinomycetota bacterium]|nr:response regulator transcription factor [Actinomycetota bacterium]PLS75366.1 MAG: DNA-binding response regulator [Actinomycetota bacterium]
MADAAGPLIRVLIVDDHEVVREGVGALLRAAGDVLVCGAASNVGEAVELAEVLRPDVVVMDVRLGADSGIEATREIRACRPATKVIMLTSFPSDDAMFASIMAGASGFVLKQIRGGDLVEAVRNVAAGKSLLDPSMTTSVLERLRRTGELKDEKLARLTAQEERILNLVADGLTNGQIAAEIHLSEKTVKNHISHILNKLEVGRRAEAAAYLARHTRTPAT